MTSGTSYQLQKTDDKVVLNRITLNFGNTNNEIDTVTLQVEELKRFRQYVQDKKLNCLTCGKMDLNFEEGYVECFRSKNHCIELLTKNKHVLCHLFGNTFQMFTGSLYRDSLLCTTCERAFQTNNIKCICCHLSLKRHPDQTPHAKARKKQMRKY